MPKRKSARVETPRTESSVEEIEKQTKQTVIWGSDVEQSDYIKLPRFLTRLGRYWPQHAPQLAPRHLILLFALAGRKYQDKKLRAYWAELADDVGKSPETVRKWAYQLRDMGLIRISQGPKRKKGEGRTGWRNDKNIFDISPFVKVARTAWELRVADRKRAQDARNGGRESADE